MSEVTPRDSATAAMLNSTATATFMNIAQFNVHSHADRPRRWDRWIRHFEIGLIANNITDDNRKKALLLFYGGPDLQDEVDVLLKVQPTSRPRPSTAAADGSSAAVTSQPVRRDRVVVQAELLLRRVMR